MKPKDTVLQAKKKIDASFSVGDTDPAIDLWQRRDVQQPHLARLRSGRRRTMALAIRGGGKTGVIKQNFMKLAKRTQAVALMENRTVTERCCRVSAH